MIAGDLTAEGIFAPLVGQMVWQVRADEHGCVMMEFGAPHLDVQEPRQGAASSSAKVERLRARRSVTSLYPWQGPVTWCDAAGRITVESEKA